eukprot:1152728-Pelagomonas_calceolata.AAC.1
MLAAAAVAAAAVVVDVVVVAVVVVGGVVWLQTRAVAVGQVLQSVQAGWWWQHTRPPKPDTAPVQALARTHARTQAAWQWQRMCPRKPEADAAHVHANKRCGGGGACHLETKLRAASVCLPTHTLTKQWMHYITSQCITPHHKA